MPKFLKKTFALITILFFLYLSITKIAAYVVDKDFNRVTLKPPYTISEKALTLYNKLPFVADLHSDVLLWNRDITKRHSHGHEDIPRMIEANMALQAFTIVSKTPKNMNFKGNDDKTDNITTLMIATGRPPATWFSLKERAIQQSKELYDFSSASQGKLRVITNQQELEIYIEDRKSNKNQTAGYLGVEGMQVLEGDLANVQAMFNAGIRMMAPTHFFDNKIGGSAHGMKKGGITPFGKEVIQKMESLHMIVDLAHASPALIDDVLKIATRAILVSHTGVKGTCNNVRNLSDAHIKGIARTGGLIGIAVFEQAVCGTNAAATAKAIKYTTDLVGVKHVAMGTDFDGAIPAHFDVTGFPLIVEELLKLGYSNADIAAIMGGNIRDFMLKNLPE
ncbi:MAG: membrane dipeptidase [Cyclobacteriaceae bacterium]|nr:membrane dipeptidase [Cyclobacteriaceae bacterium]